MILAVLPLLGIAVLAAGETLPPPDHYGSLGWLWTGIIGLLIGVKVVMDIYKDHFAEKPKPSSTYVTITQFDKQMGSLEKDMASDRAENKREHENIFLKLGGQERGLTTSLRSLEKTVERLDERTESTNATVAEMGRKIDLLLQRNPK